MAHHEKTDLILYENHKCPDQPAHLLSLISSFAVYRYTVELQWLKHLWDHGNICSRHEYLESLGVNPNPAEPGYALPLQTV